MKTVYILGAGFSIEAGAPTQANLMYETFKWTSQSLLHNQSSMHLLGQT